MFFFLLLCLHSMHSSLASYNLQIVVPERRSTKRELDKTIENCEQKLRRQDVAINLFTMSNESPNPDQLVNLYCDSVFSSNVSVILSVNYDSYTWSATEYITTIARNLGYPVLSLNPFYTGALESSDERMFLQLAPTIYHECKAMVLIMERYNWTEFSIVTTKNVGQNFIDCMDLMVKRTSIKQGYLTIPRFVNIATVILDYGEPELYQGADLSEWQRQHVRDKFKILDKARSRIILLHAAVLEAQLIVEIAQSLNYTGQNFGWILTSSSVGDISHNTAAGTYPPGLLGVSQNRSTEKVLEAIVTSSRLFAEAIKQMESEGHDESTLHPGFSCQETPKDFTRWELGKKLYRIMKSTVLQPEEKSPSRSSSRFRPRGRGKRSLLQYRFHKSSQNHHQSILRTTTDANQDGYSVDQSYGPRRTLLQYRAGRQSPPTPDETSYPISFTESGVVENEELFLVNVRRPKEVTSGRRVRRNQWDTVGRIYPKVERKETVLKIETNEIIWPGYLPFPPIGRPEKRFFRIVTLEEHPFMMFVPPDEATGECGQHSVPCIVNPNHDFVNANNTNENGTVNYCCTGFCVEILGNLAEKMQFDFVLYEVPDGQWGVQDPVTGEWTGLVREILDGKADMILTSFMINQVRNAVIDMTSPFLESGITIMVSIRKGAISPYAFLEPYDYYSWILILIFSVHATGASIFIFEWLSPSGLDQGKTSTVEYKFSLFRSFWLIWAMLFGAAVSIDVPRGVSSRFLANVWALFALVFLASYTANLAAFMITIDEYYDLTGIEDWRLIHPTKLTPHFKFATTINSSTDVNLKITYPQMHRYMTKYSQHSVLGAKENLKNNSIQAFIYDANVLEYMAGRDDTCSLLTVGRWYAMSGYGVGFKRGSPLKEEVNEIILHMQYTGDIERLQAFWLSGACHAKKDKKDKSSNKIGILNFISAFILLAAGVLLGVILLVLEHLYFKSGRKCLRKYDKCGCCALVSLSMGKSLTFEQSVFEAIDIQKKHKCKDPICEMNLWKARHQLDMALIKIKTVQRQLDTALGSNMVSSNGAEPIPLMACENDTLMQDTTI